MGDPGAAPYIEGPQFAAAGGSLERHASVASKLSSHSVVLDSLDLEDAPEDFPSESPAELRSGDSGEVKSRLPPLALAQKGPLTPHWPLFVRPNPLYPQQVTNSVYRGVCAFVMLL